MATAAAGGGFALNTQPRPWRVQHGRSSVVVPLTPCRGSTHVQASVTVAELTAMHLRERGRVGRGLGTAARTIAARGVLRAMATH